VTPASRPLIRGDIVLVAFPFTDLSTTKRRPAVVLWAEPSQVDFTLAFISSQLSSGRSSGDAVIRSTHPEFGLTGLVVDSRVRASKLATLSRGLITRCLGRLGPLLSADLDRALIAALGINTVPFREEGRRDECQRLITIHASSGIKGLAAELGLAAP